MRLKSSPETKVDDIEVSSQSSNYPACDIHLMFELTQTLATDTQNSLCCALPLFSLSQRPSQRI